LPPPPPPPSPSPFPCTPASRHWPRPPRLFTPHPPPPHPPPSRKTLTPPPTLQRVVTELGEAIPDDELREMIEEADRDADGFVVFDDFYRIMKKGGADSDEDDE
jgi:hypothetical protein